MLARDVADEASTAGHDVTGLDLPEFDVTDAARVRDALPPCDLVINCAAYTAVDNAETQRALADAVNADGPGNLAEACASGGTRFFHLSTDYVFDGSADRPYREDDVPHPLNAYGAGKLEGERRVRAAGGNALIIRVQSLFGVHGEHFIRKILRRLEGGAEGLQVVDDQVTSPTYTRHVAQALVRLAETSRQGVVHVAASGSCSWFTFAREALRLLDLENPVTPVPSSAFPTPAQRPPRSVLDTSRYRGWTGRSLPTWQEGLREYLEAEKMQT